MNTTANNVLLPGLFSLIPAKCKGRRSTLNEPEKSGWFKPWLDGFHAAGRTFAAGSQFLLAVCMFLSVVAYAGQEDWLTDFEKAKETARVKNLPILADFSGSDWCGWCIKLDKEVFSQDAFKEYAKTNLVLFLADYPQRKKLSAQTMRQNEKLSDLYKIQGFPTVLLLDANGKELARSGYRPNGSKAYVDYLRQLIAGIPAITNAMPATPTKQ